MRKRSYANSWERAQQILLSDFERCVIALRHTRVLQDQVWLWNRLRPLYNGLVVVLGRNGLERDVNGSDRLLVAPQYRGLSEVYEAETWKHLISQLRPGDTVADVGANLGLYTVAIAKRVGSAGRVIAFEPDSQNFAALMRHVQLNGVSDRVKLMPMAVGERDTLIDFDARGDSESRISSSKRDGTRRVQCVSLDTVFAQESLDILKIDVEGYEYQVMAGAIHLLKDINCRPRMIYIEAHPYAWQAFGTTDAQLLSLLLASGYQVFSSEMQRISRINHYQEIVCVGDRG